MLFIHNVKKQRSLNRRSLTRSGSVVKTKPLWMMVVLAIALLASAANAQDEFTLEYVDEPEAYNGINQGVNCSFSDPWLNYGPMGWYVGETQPVLWNAQIQTGNATIAICVPARQKIIHYGNYAYIGYARISVRQATANLASISEYQGTSAGSKQYGRYIITVEVGDYGPGRVKLILDSIKPAS